MVSYVDLYVEFLSEKEHLDQIRAQSKLRVGDTIALCLLRARFVQNEASVFFLFAFPLYTLDV